MLTCNVFAYSPYTVKTKFWLLCCYYHYTIFGHIGVNTTGMWRTVASYIDWAFHPEWDTTGMPSLCRMLLNCRQLMPWLLHTQTWCKYSIAFKLVVTTVCPCPKILHWFILFFQMLQHDCEIEVTVLNLLRNNYTWQKDENINTCMYFMPSYCLKREKRKNLAPSWELNPRLTIGLSQIQLILSL